MNEAPIDLTKSISDILADLGVTHKRDYKSTQNGQHRLYFAGQYIGRYDAHEVCALLREHFGEAGHV